MGEGDSSEELRHITRKLRVLRGRLAAIAGRLEGAETAEGLRGVIECVLADRLDPAIQSLVELQPSLDRGELLR